MPPLPPVTTMTLSLREFNKALSRPWQTDGSTAICRGYELRLLLAPFDLLQEREQVSVHGNRSARGKASARPKRRNPAASRAKRDERALYPILVVHRCAVPDCNCGHYFPELNFGEAETLADVGFTGSTTGAPLSLSRTTMNFAGFVVLAFRPTV